MRRCDHCGMMVENISYPYLEVACGGGRQSLWSQRICDNCNNVFINLLKELTRKFVNDEFEGFPFGVEQVEVTFVIKQRKNKNGK